MGGKKMETVTFYSENPYLFIRHQNIGYFIDDIKEHNAGIQFRNGVYKTSDSNTIKAFRAYIRVFVSKGIKPPIWEKGQDLGHLQANIEEIKEEPNQVDYASKIAELERFIRR